MYLSINLFSKLKYVDDGGYFAHLSIDCHLNYLARVGPGMVTDPLRLRFLASKLVVDHFGIIYLLV